MRKYKRKKRRYILCGVLLLVFLMGCSPKEIDKSQAAILAEKAFSEPILLWKGNEYFRVYHEGEFPALSEKVEIPCYIQDKYGNIDRTKDKSFELFGLYGIEKTDHAHSIGVKRGEEVYIYHDRNWSNIIPSYGVVEGVLKEISYGNLILTETKSLSGWELSGDMEIVLESDSDSELYQIGDRIQVEYTETDGGEMADFDKIVYGGRITRLFAANVKKVE